MSSSDGIFHAGKIVSAIDGGQRPVAGGLDTDLQPEFIPFFQFAEIIQTLFGEAIGARGDDQRPEIGRGQRFGVKTAQHFDRGESIGERLEISQIRPFGPIALADIRFSRFGLRP